MRVAMHQPNYLPYIGYFQKMALADVFVIMDVVQLSRGASYTKRVKIRTQESSRWLTIPIEKKYDFMAIKDVFLPQDAKWIKNHKSILKGNYYRAEYVDKNFIEEYYSEENKFSKLQEFNEFGISYLIKKFNIKAEIIRASELDLDENLKSTDLLIEVLKQIGGDVYLSGAGGKKYLDEKKFPMNGIKLEYFDFKPTVYPQRWEGFEPYLSALDLLFNLGDKAAADFIHEGEVSL